MKITILHGQSHKGSTYHIASILANKLGGEVAEVFLPQDFGEFCVGCTQCFMQGEEKCPHYKKLLNITKMIDDCDVLIMESPVYVFHATASMKALLDHYGWRWLVHRPEEKMFYKQAVCISTAAGAGTKSTNKDMADSAFWWGISHIFKYGIPVGAINWQSVEESKKQKVEKATSKIAKKIISNYKKHVKPTIKMRILFAVMGRMQKNGFNEKDVLYWKQKGWTSGKKPW